MEKRVRRTHTAEFKAQAVVLASELKSVNKAASQLGLTPNLLRLWIKKYSGGGVTKSAIMSQQQLEDGISSRIPTFSNLYNVLILTDQHMEVYRWTWKY